MIWCSMNTHDLVLPYAMLLSGVGLVLLAAFFKRPSRAVVRLRCLRPYKARRRKGTEHPLLEPHGRG